MNMTMMRPMVLALGLSSAFGGAVAQEPMKPSGVAEALMANDEKDFFETAASSNMFEIQASQLAMEKSTDPAIKKYAEQMVEDHQMANEKLQKLAESKNVTLPTTLLKRHQAMLDDLKEEKAGKEFDEEYADKMVMSHKEAVSLFDQTAKKGKDPEVKSFAAEMLPKLQMHGGMATELEKKS